MAATPTNRSRRVTKRRPQAKVATTSATSASRKATRKLTGRTAAATKARSVTRNATKKVTGQTTPAPKARNATRKATEKVAGRAKATTDATSATRKANKKVTGKAKIATKAKLMSPNTTKKVAGKAAASTARRPSDVIALIKADHAAVDRLFKGYGDLGPSALKSRLGLAARVIKELSVHAAVEEQILYPKVRTTVPNGERLVSEALDEHQSVKKALAELVKCEPESKAFDELMARVRDDVRHHVKEEEASDGILGRLRKHTSRAELREMATMMRAAKKSAPTRPHPNAPSTPPRNIFIGAAAAIVDKARDTLTGRN